MLGCKTNCNHTVFHAHFTPTSIDQALFYRNKPGSTPSRKPIIKCVIISWVLQEKCDNWVFLCG